MDLSFYYDLICKQPLLSRDEENTLLEIYHSPDSTPAQKKKARDRLITANLRFAFKRAKVLSNGNQDQFEELIMAGNEGLIVALDKFEPGKNVRFLTYAGWWVRQRQYKQMSMMRIVALPILKQQISAKIMKVVETFEYPPTAEEIHAILPDIPMKDIRELYSTRYLTFYLEDLTEDEVEHNSFLEDLVDEIDDDLLARKLRDSLTEAEHKAIQLGFGLDDGNEKTLGDVALMMGLEKDEVRDLRKSALSKLKKTFKVED